jgi:predicted dehydrogenase
MSWGPQIDSINAYVTDKSNGATMLTIPVGHTLSAVVGALGPVAELSAVLANRRTSAHVADKGTDVPMTSHDQVLLSGLLESGAPISLHYRGGTCHGSGFVWEVNGTEGELRISGPFGHPQLCTVSLSGAKGDDTSFQPIVLPADLASDAKDGPVAGNVRRVYAAMLSDLRNGTKLAPTFDHAIELHQIIAAVEEAAASGKRVQPSKM